MEIETLQPPTMTPAAIEPDDVPRTAKPSLLAVITLVLWMMTLAIGLIGLLLSRPRHNRRPSRCRLSRRS